MTWKLLPKSVSYLTFICSGITEILDNEVTYTKYRNLLTGTI